MEKLRDILNETWHFYKRTLSLVVKGSKVYYVWCLSLFAMMIIGFLFFLKQHEVGLITTLLRRVNFVKLLISKVLTGWEEKVNHGNKILQLNTKILNKLSYQSCYPFSQKIL